MHADLDARARQAAGNLKATVQAAPLHVAPPVPLVRKRPPVMRPAWVVAALVFGSAVGLAMVVEPQNMPVTTSAPTTTIASSTTTTAVPVTTAAPVPPPPTTPVETTAPTDTTAPMLTITSPAEGTEFTTKTIEFAGITEPGASVFAGPYQAEVDSEGNWRIILVLSPGANTAKFTARDAANNESQATVTVHYVIPAPSSTTTTSETKEVAAFEAHAKFGFCSEPAPFDEYYGTGEPGTQVYVHSEYGQGSVAVNDQGRWEVTVFFEGLAPEQTIDVKVFDDLGRKKILKFTFKP